jgi:hypothetical protein
VLVELSGSHLLKVMSALITARTKTIFRSKSAQSFIFLQLCREMYEFDEDGERYYEKALYGKLWTKVAFALTVEIHQFKTTNCRFPT